jgi:hypothetical protein
MDHRGSALTDLPDELLVSIFHHARRVSLGTFMALASVLPPPPFQEASSPLAQCVSRPKCACGGGGGGH